MRLDFSNGGAFDSFESFDFILQSEAVDFLQHGQLIFGRGGHNLSADVVSDMVLLRKGDQLVTATHTIGRFEASRRVIQAAVNDAAVVTGLVVAQNVLFLEKGNLGLGVATLQLIECSGTYYATANDDKVKRSGWIHGGVTFAEAKIVGPWVGCQRRGAVVNQRRMCKCPLRSSTLGTSMSWYFQMSR